MLRDILRYKDPDIQAAAEIVALVSPDVLLLSGIDWDYGLAGARALADRFAAAGADYPHIFALRPNTGMATGLDMDGDGRLGGARDAQGYGWYAGQGGMLLLSRLPIDADKARDFTGLRWRDFPDPLLPEVDGAPFPSEAALDAQLLSHTGHWDVPVLLPSGKSLHLLCFAAGPPVFDGPEDRNGKRTHDEVMLWVRYLQGALGPLPEGPVVVLGNANTDPVDGDGLHEAIGTLIGLDRLQDPAPVSLGGVEAASQGGANARHRGDPALDTADWTDDPGPGNLRVSYVLPDAAFQLGASGVFWPVKGDPLRRLVEGEVLPRHRLVWVDLVLDR